MSGRLVESTDSLGNRLRITYDAVGNRLTEVNENGTSIDYRYDSEGRQTAKTVNSLLETYRYDEVGRLVARMFAYGTSEHVLLDSNGNVLERTTRDGLLWRYVYKSGVSLESVIDPSGNISHLGYNSVGANTSVEDSLGRITKISYNEVDQMATKTLPLGQRASFEYDASGLPIGRADFNGDSYAIRYDSAGRLAEVRNAGGIVIESRTYTGQLDTVQNDYGTTRFETVSRDLLRITDIFDVPVEYKHLTYTSASRSIGSRATKFEYSDKGSLAAIVESNDERTTIEYDSFGMPRTVSFPNGVQRRDRFAPDGKVISSALVSPQNTTVSEFKYTRNALNRIVKIDGLDEDRFYTYDQSGRLQSEKRTNDGSAMVLSEYEYDAVGNLVKISRNGKAVNLVYDANDRLISNGRIEYKFDGNGNLIERRLDSKIESFAYDYRQQIAKVSIALDGQIQSVVEYKYHSNGLLASRSVNGIETRYVWDQISFAVPFLVEVHDASGLLLREYSNDGSHYTQFRDSVGSVTLLITDQVGTVRGTTDGSSVVSFDFDAFGKTDSVNSLEIGFAGGFQDPLTGLTYFASRWYDPQSARFISLDSDAGELLDTRTFNRYVYSLGDPINRSDPTGQFSSLIETLQTTAFYSSLVTGIVGFTVANLPDKAISWLSGGRVNFVNKTGISRPFFEANFGLAGGAKKGVNVGVTGDLGLELLTIYGGPGSQLFLYFGISAGASASVSSEKDSRQTAISGNLRSAVSDVFEAQESPGDYAGHYVTFSGGFVFKLSIAEKSGFVSGGFSLGHMSSIGFSPGKNSRGTYTHTRTVFGAGANVMSGGSGIAVTATISGGISYAYYFPVGDPF